MPFFVGPYNIVLLLEADWPLWAKLEIASRYTDREVPDTTEVDMKPRPGRG